jgi:hypothetical protein
MLKLALELETEENRSAANSPDTMTVTLVFLVMKL